MKNSLLKYKLIQTKKPLLEHKPHPVFMTSITADPYVGCRFSCLYCPAGNGKDSPGVKTNLVGLLKKKLEEISKEQKKPALRPSVMLGGTTDPYQEAEKEMMVSKRCIELLVEREFPLQVFTKSEGVLRDAELLSAHSAKGLAAVNVTLFSLDNSHWRAFESRTPPPKARLEIISELKKKNILCGLVLMPVFPGLNDEIRCLERAFSAAKKAGAEYVIAGCFSPAHDSIMERVRETLKEKFKDAADGFSSAYGLSGRLGGGYVMSLEKTLYSLSKEYDLPLNIPVPGAKPALNLEADPFL